jgi:hypothetical protein
MWIQLRAFAGFVSRSWAWISAKTEPRVQTETLAAHIRFLSNREDKCDGCVAIRDSWSRPRIGHEITRLANEMIPVAKIAGAVAFVPPGARNPKQPFAKSACQHRRCYVDANLLMNVFA